MLRAGKSVQQLGRQLRCLSTSNSASNVLSVLKERGFVHQVTHQNELENALSSPQVIYSGIDPTAASLHIGHLVPLMSMLHFQLHGHTTISLMGGATGLIGDPSGRKTEREPANVQQVEANVNSISENVKKFFARAVQYASNRLSNLNASNVTEPVLQSNLSWHQDFGMLEFLRTVGIHARVNTMISRDSVRTRLESSAGLSFTEFTYQLLQAYDFFHLHRHFGCTIQVGGSDQWGNIVAGLELISRSDSADPKVFGITTPLLTTASGEKFGKSAGNAVWLDPKLTSVFDFYQYFLKVEDADVEKYLKLFTLLPISRIQEVMQNHQAEPEKRIAQRVLAAEVTELVHEASGAAQAEKTTKVAFRQPNTTKNSLDAQSIIGAFEGDPRFKWCEREELHSTPVIKLASKYSLVPSTSAARQLVQSRGLYLNNAAISEVQFTLKDSDLLEGQVAVIRAGKDKLLVLAVK
ncbi:hypothetical protein D9758_001640 [Tetrapyrgos nigripes]|uniref:Tyrosine--tRNA ligase n=1 Tax=Tetrapyrgos nigripes TaxID=182062 RepID=A0A8H5GXZ0_9AGAR|nr:hypothetical protein D9758_001640 [Tetrapyrgos nigripes]